jgi:hypothetical protein
MTDQALHGASLAAPAAGARGGPDPLLVRTAEQQRHQLAVVEQACTGQCLDDRGFIVVRAGPARRKCPPDLAGEIANEAVQHRGHQGPLLLGQPLGRIQKEVDANGGQPAPARGACRRVPLRGSDNRPLFRHHYRQHYPISVNFASTPTTGVGHAG